ncbi:MAG: AAA family ATPase [Corynebacteriales bacterium]|nr:AAA family ATPase [Mycobacteriales bacterium]
MSYDGRERGGADLREVASPVQPDATAPDATASDTTDTDVDADTTAEVVAAPVANPVVDAGPYRSLTPYSEADGDIFFGRTDLWRRLHVRAVPGGGLVTVVGPTGAGKTSLVHAGLVPEVRRSGLRRDGERVAATVATMTPGSAPMTALDAARGAADPDDHPHATACLLVVDQAEELFTLCDCTARTEFLAALDRLAADRRFAVVIVLRADHYARAVAEPVLVGTLDDRAVVVRTMSDDELLAAIESPARTRGASVEAGLGPQIIADLHAAESGAPDLVALGMTMDHLWRTRADDTLTLAAYRASDPLDSVVADTAERAWTRLTEADRRTARLVLLATVRVTADGEVVAADVARTDLHTRLGRHRRLDTVIDHLVGANIVRVVDGRLRLTHDSLLVAWPRLADWAAQRRADAPIRAAVIADAGRWDAGGHPADELYDEARLQSADRAVEPVDVLGAPAEAFLARSRERAALRRSRRRVLLGVLVFVAVVSLVVAVTSVIGGSHTASERDAARTDAALARIGATAASDPTASARLALQAFRAAPGDPRAESALLATQSTPLARPLSSLPPSVAVATTGSARSDRVALTSADGTVRITGPDAAVTATVDDATTARGPQSVALDAGATLLAAAGDVGAVRLWPVDAAGAITGAPVVVGGGPSPVESLTFAPNRPWLADVDAAGAVRVIDVADPRRPLILSTLPGQSATRTAVFAPPATPAAAPTLVVGSADRRVTAWDLSNPRSPVADDARLVLDNPVAAVAVTAGGDTLAAADASGSVTLASLSASGLTRVGPGLGRSGAVDPGVDDTVVGVSSLSFAPTGHRLAVTSADGSTRVWDVTHAGLPRVLTGDLRSESTTIAAARFTDASTLVTTGSGVPQVWSLPRGLLDGGFGGVATPACSTAKAACATSFVDGPVQVWNAADPSVPLGGLVIDAPDHFDGAAMSPDGRWMMTVDAGHLAQLWDVSGPGAPLAVGAPVALGPQPVGTIRFSPTSSMLAMSLRGNTAVGVYGVDRRGLTPVADLDLGGAPVAAVAFSADAGQIALGGSTGVVRTRLTPSGTGQVSGRLTPGSPITALGYVDGDVVVGDSTGGITRYRADTGGQVGPRTPLGRWAVTSIVALGTTTATASADGTVHRIGADGSVRRVGNLYGTADQGPARLTALGDDTVLVTGDGGAQQFWSLRTDDVAAQVCRATASDGCAAP